MQIYCWRLFIVDFMSFQEAFFHLLLCFFIYYHNLVNPFYLISLINTRKGRKSNICTQSTLIKIPICFSYHNQSRVPLCTNGNWTHWMSCDYDVWRFLNNSRIGLAKSLKIYLAILRGSSSLPSGYVWSQQKDLSKRKNWKWIFNVILTCNEQIY